MQSSAARRLCSVIGDLHETRCATGNGFLLFTLNIVWFFNMMNRTRETIVEQLYHAIHGDDGLHDGSMSRRSDATNVFFIVHHHI